ncbi:hypothetical protein B0H13DRAFT_1880557 [Mycena leptocephala]|nr:hypothetical protein B0H13DRAFT_1880557 [Mycena leptocephala]
MAMDGSPAFGDGQDASTNDKAEINILTELGIQDMRFVGELRYGKYADDFENVHPDILQRYANEGDLDLAITGDQDRHIRHEAIKVTEHQFLFGSIIPIGMGVAEVEWEDGFYAETEAVKVGRKDIETPLPFRVWWPRAAAWAQGLEMMAKIRAPKRSQTVKNIATYTLKKLLSCPALERREKAVPAPDFNSNGMAPLARIQNAKTASIASRHIPRALSTMFWPTVWLNTMSWIASDQSQSVMPMLAGNRTQDFAPRRWEIQKKSATATPSQASTLSRLAGFTLSPVDLICQEEKELRETRCPAGQAVEKLRKQGSMVFKDPDGSPLAFSVNWTPTRSDQWIRDMFPKMARLSPV